MTHS